MATKSLEDVYEALRAIMSANTDGLGMIEDRPGSVKVERVAAVDGAKPKWFGAVQTKKNYVSYHLMPVYENPRLLDDISPELKARMQGKSCFNFKAIDPDLFAQLAALTTASTTDFQP